MATYARRARALFTIVTLVFIVCLSPAGSASVARGIGRGTPFLGVAGKTGFVFSAEGDSLLGASTAAPDPIVQTQNMITASGLSLTLQGFSHGGASLEPIPGNVAGSLAGFAPSEVDPLVDPTKWNVHWVYEITNTIWYYTGLLGMSAPAAVAATQADLFSYLSSRTAAGWNIYVICSVLPRQNTGTSPNFEAARQSMNAWLLANAASNGWYIADIGNDPRIGDVSAPTNGYWYLTDLVHTQATANGIVCSYVMEQLRSIFHVPYIPAHAPYVWINFDVQSGGLFDGSGNPVVNGSGVATWNNASLYGGATATQATPANQMIYSATGWPIHSLPALDAAPSKWLQTTTEVGMSTSIVVAVVAADGFAFDISGSINFFVDFNDASTTSWSILGQNLGGTSALVASAGEFADSSPHVWVSITDGTHAGTVLYRDGNAVALTTYGGDSADPGDRLLPENVFIDGNNGLPSYTGLLAALYQTPVPLTNHERGLFESYLASEWGI